MRITHVGSSSKRAMGTSSSRKSKTVGSSVARKKAGLESVSFAICQTAPQDFVAILVEQERLSVCSGFCSADLHIINFDEERKITHELRPVIIKVFYQNSRTT